jgi:hypothetical protein
MANKRRPKKEEANPQTQDAPQVGSDLGREAGATEESAAGTERVSDISDTPAAPGGQEVSQPLSKPRTDAPKTEASKETPGGQGAAPEEPKDAKLAIMVVEVPPAKPLPEVSGEVKEAQEAMGQDEAEVSDISDTVLVPGKEKEEGRRLCREVEAVTDRAILTVYEQVERLYVTRVGGRRLYEYSEIYDAKPGAREKDFRQYLMFRFGNRHRSTLYNLYTQVKTNELLKAAGLPPITSYDTRFTAPLLDRPDALLACIREVEAARVASKQKRKPEVPVR